MPIKKELQTIIDLESSARVLPVGAHLYRQGDQCSTAFVVLSGWIALSILLDDGSCQILDFALPGTVLGISAAPNAPMYHSAGCLSLARVCAIPQQKLDVIIETNTPRRSALPPKCSERGACARPPYEPWPERFPRTNCAFTA
jgi:CRP-like cAMP-binding protein